MSPNRHLWMVLYSDPCTDGPLYGLYTVIPVLMDHDNHTHTHTHTHSDTGVDGPPQTTYTIVPVMMDHYTDHTQRSLYWWTTTWTIHSDPSIDGPLHRSYTAIPVLMDHYSDHAQWSPRQMDHRTTIARWSVWSWTTSQTNHNDPWISGPLAVIPDLMYSIAVLPS